MKDDIESGEIEEEEFVEPVKMYKLNKRNVKKDKKAKSFIKQTKR